MKKKFLLMMVATTMIASCAHDHYSGTEEVYFPDLEPDTLGINFAGGNNTITRADASGDAAASLLNNTFRLYGTVLNGTRETAVLDNYVVKYVEEDYFGIDSVDNRHWSYNGYTSKGLKPAIQEQKYWDLDADEYNFVAFAGLDDGIRMNSAKSNTISVDQANKTRLFISDRVTAKKGASVTGTTINAQYGNIVNLTFKRLCARIRLGLYETIPGYAVKDVRFYYDDNYLDVAGTSTKTVAGLHGDFPSSGDVTISYDENNNVVADYIGDNKANSFQFGELDYVKAASTLLSGGYLREDGTIDAEGDAKFLGTTSATPTYARNNVEVTGDSLNDGTWHVVLPYASNSSNLVIRVDFTLVSLDGVGLPITVKGASAVVPDYFAQWKPSYAYTYIFKITDESNGTTGQADPNPVDPDTINVDIDPEPHYYPLVFDIAGSSIVGGTQDNVSRMTDFRGEARKD